MTKERPPFRVRFSPSLRWALVAVIAILLSPSVITFVRNQIDDRDRLRADERRFERFHRDLNDVLQHRATGQPVDFPECIRETSISARDMSTITFYEVDDIANQAPNTLLCETKREYANGRLVLLLDGTIAFRHADRTVSPFGPQEP